ncbi:unnamed protein product [Rodentolepis nana]|uniref:poly(A)-specific ribonuclease n=1 Tax=Rodentolepis nana TaxID=102285 RepID=A0A0R3TKM1_RODNA|nr:unnamed protein product [Rodentolepis nana]
MQSYREVIPVTQNGYIIPSNVVNSNSNPESSFPSSSQKYNMAVAADMFGNQNRLGIPPNHLSHSLSYQTSNFPRMHPVSTSADCHGFNGYSSVPRVYEVWNSNFAEGVLLLRKLTKNAKFVAVDTEFPGIVAKVHGEFMDSIDQAYHNIKANTEIMRPIQLGFSFFDDGGVGLESPSTIQFNLNWNVDNDTHATESINLLQASGIDFYKLKRDGIDHDEFAEAMIGVGLACNPDVTWIGFHSAYDFAYLMKVCTGWDQMPFDWKEFNKLLQLFFPRVVDLKTLLAHHGIFKGGLQEVADNLKVRRCGSKHQAGSDSMLTGETFFRFLEKHSRGDDMAEILNLIYGFNFAPIIPGNHNPLLNGSFHEHSHHRTETAEENFDPDDKKTHSAGESGRSSPESSLDGHKSS